MLVRQDFVCFSRSERVEFEKQQVSHQPMDSPVPPNPSVHITVRPVRQDDEPYLRELRAESDSERLLLDYVIVEEALKKRLLEHQFDARQSYFREADWDKKECLIEMELQPVGSFVVMQDSGEIRLADIVIQKSHRGLGIGFAIIQSIQQESVRSNRPLRLHVEKNNPALEWYGNIGFRVLEDQETHFFLEWTSPDQRGKTLYFPST